MKVLMFGWEYPPHISGGLGTACFGLTKSLTKKGVSIDFVVPRLYGDEFQSGANVRSASGVLDMFTQAELFSFEKDFSIMAIDSSLLPYESEADYKERMKARKNFVGGRNNFFFHPSADTKRDVNESYRTIDLHGGYGGNLFEEVARYALVAGSIAKQGGFDIIHAHDWLCYKAGEVAKKISGKPLIVHVHATEFDRSGENINHRVYEMERSGMEAADLIVCVSEYTRDTVIHKYAQPSQKVVCVYNGVETQNQNYMHIHNSFGKKMVGFIGRVTYQKGPDYFIEAAAKVLEKDKDFLFVMAGEGDMLDAMVALAAKKRISENFFFTGFLQGEELKRLLQMCDAYVMPSVSEPFGIAPLEAMGMGVPTIISRQSGVSEILKNVIKVDFWDIDAMADAVYSIGKRKTLSEMLSRQGKAEAETITWDKAADKLKKIYSEMIH